LTGEGSWSWPATGAELVRIQDALAAADPPPWTPSGDYSIGACFACFDRREGRGERGWAGAAILGEAVVVEGDAGAPYEPGLLALREGPLLEAAVRRLSILPDVLLVNATGRDHPRRAGLALHLGAVLDLPTVGVTERPLAAMGAMPRARRGASAPLYLEKELAGFWVRTRHGIRPVVAHAAWRTAPSVATEVVIAATKKARTPEMLRRARRVARAARGNAGG